MIEEFDWTYHARRRVRQRRLDRFEIEMTIRLGHSTRQPNAGEADWRVEGERIDGTRFQVVYDHPVQGDADPRSRRERLAARRQEAILIPMEERFAYYDREADIAWIPTAPTEHVVSEETRWGLVDHDEETGEVTALEIWDAGKVFPAEMLERLPSPGQAAA